MPNLQQITDRLKKVSGQVSSQIRASALGLLGISWVLLTAHKDPLQSMVRHVSHRWFIAIAIIATTVLALDLLQYIAYTMSADEALDRASNTPTKEAPYAFHARASRAGDWLYKAKVVTLFAGGILLVVVFCLLLVH